MNYSVVKLGGGNLKSPSEISKRVALVASYPKPLVVVVAAYNGLTDRISEYLTTYIEQGKDGGSLTSMLRSEILSILNLNIMSEGIRETCLARINERIDQMGDYLKGSAILGYVSPSAHDQILSYGERLTSAIITGVLQQQGLNALERLPEDFGLLTDGVFGNATFPSTQRPGRYAPHFAAEGGEVFIIPGFYGVSCEGSTTLLGSGGGDYTATALAYSLGSTQVDIWTDNDGLYSCKPSLTPQARTIPKLSHQEAAELAYFGASILHPKTMDLVSRTGIRVNLLNINQPNAGARTVISKAASTEYTGAKCITGSTNFGILSVMGPAVGFKPGILARITSAFDAMKLNIASVITSQTAINFLLAANDIEAALHAAKQENLGVTTTITARKSIAVIAVVGHGIVQEVGFAALVLSALAKRVINVDLVSGGASPVAVYLIVDAGLLDDAVRAIHEELIDSGK